MNYYYLDGETECHIIALNQGEAQILRAIFGHMPSDPASQLGIVSQDLYEFLSKITKSAAGLEIWAEEKYYASGPRLSSKDVL